MDCPIRLGLDFGAGEAGPITPQRLVRDLTAAVRALERQAPAHGGPHAGGSAEGTSFTITLATQEAMANLQRACNPPAAAAEVPLPWPSPEVEAALDGLARLISTGRACGAAHASATICALFAVHMVATSSMASALTLARHGELARALAGALAARGEGEGLLAHASNAALPILAAASIGPAGSTPPLWRARESGANLRTLAVAAAAAFGAPCVFGAPGIMGAGAEAFEDYLGFVLAAAIAACPPPDKAGLRSSMLAQDGVADALCSYVARAAAAVPPRPGAPNPAVKPPGTGALTVIAALCGDGALAMFHKKEEGVTKILFVPRLEKQPPPAPPRAGAGAGAGAQPAAMIDRLMAAAPTLLGRVVDVVTAGAPWYAAVAAALPGRDGGGGRGGVPSSAVPLVSGFFRLENPLWIWALSVLELFPAPVLAAAAGARLAPALLGLAEAAQAVAEVPPGPGAGHASVTGKTQPGEMALVAAVAVSLFDTIVRALGADAAAALLAGAPGALEPLARLSAAETPALAAADPLASETATYVFSAHCRVRLRATQALDFLTAGSAQLTRQLAALLAASPALAEELGAAVGESPGERRFARGVVAHVVAELAQRRALAAGLLARVAAAAAGGGGASWLRGLAT